MITKGILKKLNNLKICRKYISNNRVFNDDIWVSNDHSRLFKYIYAYSINSCIYIKLLLIPNTIL